MSKILKCDNLTDVDFAQTSTTSLKNEQILLKWAATKRDIFNKIEERSFDLPTGKIYSFNVHGISQRLHRKFLCTGRNPNRTIAASKAIGEFLERAIAAEILLNGTLYATHSIEVSKDSGISVRSAGPAYLPSKGLHSSNGWAVHFDRSLAIEKALSEALERHILLLSFLKYGWDGFNYIAAEPFQEIRFGSIFSRCEVAGYRAGIAMSQIDLFPGFVMGYCCDTSQTFLQSHRWTQAFFEAFETAQYYKHHPNSGNPWALEFGQELLALYHDHYLRNSAPRFRQMESEGALLLESPRINANLLVASISEHFDIEAPLYAAYVFGGDLIPLFFKQRISDEEASCILNILRRHGVTGDLPEYHPVI